MPPVQMIDNRERDSTHTTVELEKMRLIWSVVEHTRAALVVGSSKPELAANGRPFTRTANGRLHPRSCDLSVSCNDTALNVLSREFVDCVSWCD